MNQVIALLICISILSGCALLEAEPVMDEVEPEDIPTIEEFLADEDDEPETLGDLAGIDEPEEEINETAELNETKGEVPARIDITIGDDSSRAVGHFYGETIDETFSYTDLDAIMFDVARVLNTELDQIRLVAYIDGEPFLKPSQSQATVDLFAEIKEKKTDFSDIPIIFAKQEGIVRAIGCDLDESIIKFVFYNNQTEDIPFYAEVIPKIKNALVMYLNKKSTFDLYCEDNKKAIPAGESLECIKAGVRFLAAKTTNILGENASYYEGQKDQLVLSRPGFKEIFNFECTPNAIPINYTFTIETNQSNSSETE